MKQRGRPSSASLAVVPISGALDRVPRQRAPADLTEEAAEVWVAVVNSEAADWFSPATVPLLAQYCRHVVQARVVAAKIAQAASDPGLTVADYDKLLHMQDRETRMIVALATKMRLSQQSTINKRANKKAPPGRKLWDRCA